MSATSETSRINRDARARLPLTPRVTSGRRGSHAPIRSETAVERPQATATAPLHITPDVIVAPRGDLAVFDQGRSFSDALGTRALELRRLRD